MINLEFLILNKNDMEKDFYANLWKETAGDTAKAVKDIIKTKINTKKDNLIIDELKFNPPNSNGDIEVFNSYEELTHYISKINVLKLREWLNNLET